MSSYEFDKYSNSYTLKNNLHSNQIEMIDFANQAINKLNSKLLKKFNKKENEVNDSVNALEDKKPKQFKLYTNSIDKETYFQIIDKSILENTIKIKELNSEYKDYSIIHSHLAQSVVHKVADDFTYYFKALKQYSTSKTSFIDNEELSEYNLVKSKTTQDTKHQLSGKRNKQIFVTKNGVKLHADINGRFNIVRKVLKIFVYNKVW